MYHFVYLSYEENTEKNYIGKRSSLNPYDNYLGSFSDKSFHPTHKIILGYYKTSQEALVGEIMWQRVFNVKDDKSFANQVYQTSKKFDCTGRKHTLNTKEKMSVSQKECQNREEIRLKKSKNIKESFKSKEIRIKHKIAMQKIGRDKEVQVKKSLSLKTKVDKVHNTEEWKIKQSISQKKSQNTKETKQLKSSRIKEAMQKDSVILKLKKRKNPQKGKIWVNDGHDSMMVFPDKIPVGYKKGRLDWKKL